MNFGLSADDHEILEELVLIPLSTVGANFWCFGSRARGDFSKFSDIDILVSPKNAELESVLSLVREKIEQSNFPYKVDLVFEVDVAASYRKQVQAEKVLWNLPRKL
jgi:uncharacterized protein